MTDTEAKAPTDTLIARLESAVGPDRELFVEAARVVFGITSLAEDDWKALNFPPADRFIKRLDAEAWTSAAEMLVPEGWHVSVNTTVGALLQGSAAVRDRDGGPSFASAAATPALALAAAALKARGV